ncbi:hypothetical protein [Coleofasciculus sp. H7-2]
MSARNNFVRAGFVLPSGSMTAGIDSRTRPYLERNIGAIAHSHWNQ